jgi:uncharacterized protein YegJ (DUF2314 family)
LILPVLAAAVAFSCDRPDAGRAEERRTALPAAPPDLWVRIEQDDRVAVVDETTAPGLNAAMAEAQRTAAEARQRWLASGPLARARWFVKWAAMPAAGEGIEHLWVQPLAWSPFRIEGRLASTPARPLAGGRTLGDLVSFPIEELSDWVYLTTGTFDGPREGGFTVRWLEEKFGTPQDAPSSPFAAQPP